MTNFFRCCLVALVATAVFVAPSDSQAQTYYSGSVGTPIVSTPVNGVANSQIYSSPVISTPASTPYVSSPVVSSTWINSAPVVSSYPTSNYSSYPAVSTLPVSVYQAPFVSPATNVYRGYSYNPQPLYVAPGAEFRLQQYQANRPREYFDGQTLYVTGPLGFTSRRRTPWGQASYYQGQADRLERAYTGESRDQQEMRRYRAARQEFNARVYQRFPNNPLLRLGTNMFFGPNNPSDD